MSGGMAAAAILIAGACTFLLRALPSLIFGSGRKMPPFFSYLGRALTPAIMAVLLVYCMKDSFSNGWAALLPQLIGVAVVAALHLWKHSALLSIALGTVVYMLLISRVF